MMFILEFLLVFFPHKNPLGINGLETNHISTDRKQAYKWV